jgi:hypothetical protein
MGSNELQTIVFPILHTNAIIGNPEQIAPQIDKNRPGNEWNGIIHNGREVEVPPLSCNESTTLADKDVEKCCAG